MTETKPTWNELRLDRPPNARWQTDTQRFDVASFRGILEKPVKDLESQTALAAEAALLSRLIYRMKCKFRNDKGLKYMGKVNKALLNYLSLALAKEYKNLIDYTEVEGGTVTLPSRQMLEYVLVRIQGFAKLMDSITLSNLQSLQLVRRTTQAFEVIQESRRKLVTQRPVVT